MFLSLALSIASMIVDARFFGDYDSISSYGSSYDRSISVYGGEGNYWQPTNYEDNRPVENVGMATGLANFGRRFLGFGMRARRRGGKAASASDFSGPRGRDKMNVDEKDLLKKKSDDPNVIHFHDEMKNTKSYDAYAKRKQAFEERRAAENPKENPYSAQDRLSDAESQMRQMAENDEYYDEEEPNNAKKETKGDDKAVDKGDDKGTEKVDDKVDNKESSKGDDKASDKDEIKADDKTDKIQDKGDNKADDKADDKADAKVDDKMDDHRGGNKEDDVDSKIEENKEDNHEVKKKVNTIDSDKDSIGDNKMEIKGDNTEDDKVENKEDNKLDNKVDNDEETKDENNEENKRNSQRGFGDGYGLEGMLGGRDVSRTRPHGNGNPKMFG